MKKKSLFGAFLAILFLNGFGAFAQNCSADFYTNPNYSNYLNFYFQAMDSTANSFAWDFGDGNTASNYYTNHTYAGPGTYVVQLTITTSQLCTDTQYDTIQILAPNCQAGLSITSTGQGDYTFTDSSYSTTSNVSSNLIINGPNYFSHNSMLPVNNSVSENGLLPGTYNYVYYYNNNATNCSDTLNGSFTVACNMNTSFNTTVDSVNPNYIHFTANPSHPNSSFSWSMGANNANRTGVNTSYHYVDAGFYVVTLTELWNGCSGTFSDTIQIDSNGVECQAGVLVSENHGAVTFTDNSTTLSAFNNTQSYVEFDLSHNLPYHTLRPNSTTSTSHLNAGTYVFSYKVIDQAYNCADSIIDSITVQCSYADLNYSTTNNGTVVTFQNQTNDSSLTNVSYSWDFGNGATSNLENPTHDFGSFGYHSFSWTINYDQGCSRTINDSVFIPSECEAHLNIFQDGFDVSFTDQSVYHDPNTGSLLWVYDNNGQFLFSQYILPDTTAYLHTFNPGDYTYRYQLYDSVYQCSSSDSAGFSVPVNCQASFTLTPNPANGNQTIGVNTSTGVNLTYAWDFGDGSAISNDPFPTHTYDSTGVYVVCLTVSNSNCSDTHCDTLIVTQKAAGHQLIVIPEGETLNTIEVESLTVSLYPNPTEGKVNISSGVLMNRYEVMDLNGRVILTEQFTASKFLQMDLTGFDQGMYMISVTDVNGITSAPQRIIIK